ncbi:MAG: SAM-dependent chlorinase/fluorinase, partial [Acidobacteriota bacterium]|nr:SAM-dependent chlorinase/fluorinase [Acidobacteriota bacterium]
MKNRRGDTVARRRDLIKPSASVSASSRLPGPLITLLTDFGTADYFVGAVKGVILSINPAATIVDITHEIPPQDIEAAAFTLLAAYATFPLKTVHVAVVDPGVGSSRRPILVEAAGQFFVGPDNGIFSYLCDSVKNSQVFHLTNAKYFRQPVSPTFNGRDVFAPVAAAISNGADPQQLGDKIKDYVRLKPLMPEKSRKGEIKGRVIHIDRFGNCVTNITRKDVPDTAAAKLRIKGTLVKSFRNYFAEETASRDKIFG